MTSLITYLIYRHDVINNIPDIDMTSSMTFDLASGSVRDHLPTKLDPNTPPPCPPPPPLPSPPNPRPCPARVRPALTPLCALMVSAVTGFLSEVSVTPALHLGTGRSIASVWERSCALDATPVSLCLHVLSLLETIFF